jgi:hypothetical protein
MEVDPEPVESGAQMRQETEGAERTINIDIILLAACQQNLNLIDTQSQGLSQGMDRSEQRTTRTIKQPVMHRDVWKDEMVKDS